MATSEIVSTVGADNSNSYTTLEEANQYFDNRLNASAWDDAADNTKIRALLQATKNIDSMSYIGNPYYLNVQALEFPRRFPEEIVDINILLTMSPILFIDNPSQEYPETFNQAGSIFIPQQIKDAQCEQALYLIVQGKDAERRAALQGQGVKQFRIDDFSEVYGTGGDIAVVCNRAKDLLANFLDTSLILNRG